MKKLSSYLMFLIILLFTGLNLPAEIVQLPGFLGKPTSINLDDQRIFITDGPVVFIYSLKDFKLQTKFGRKGEGPGEFVLFPGINRIGLRLCVDGEHIIVHHMRRVSFFTKAGKFIEQKRLPGEMGIQMFKPFGNKYVGFSDDLEKKQITINIYSPQTLQKEKELFKRKRRPYREGEVIDILQLAIIFKDDSRRGIIYQLYKDKLVVEGREGVIHILDSTGKELRRINFHDYQKIKPTKDFEQEVFKHLEKRMASGTARLRRQGEFPKYFPYRFFNVDSGKIYVLSFAGEASLDNNKEKAGKGLFFVFDMQGKLQKKVWLPFRDSEFLYAYPFTIKNGKLYQLVENEDSGDWELSIHDI